MITMVQQQEERTKRIAHGDENTVEANEEPTKFGRRKLSGVYGSWSRSVSMFRGMDCMQYLLTARKPQLPMPAYATVH